MNKKIYTRILIALSVFVVVSVVLLRAEEGTGLHMMPRFLSGLGTVTFVQGGEDGFGKNVDTIFKIQESSTSGTSYQKDTTVTLLTFGDMMLDRAIRKKMEEKGALYPFEKIAPLLQGVDEIIVNAEGPFTDNPSVAKDINSPLRFTFDPSLLAPLKSVGFTVFSQANNHTYDFGKEGSVQSKKYIEEQGIHVFGDFKNKENIAHTTQVRGRKITFVGYNQFSYAGKEEVLQAIAKGKQESSFVVVYPHWGVEYNEGVTESQRSLAYTFIDAGADVIIGSHPHVIEPVEMYKGKVIFYSLGNFIFDQEKSGPTAEGLSVGIELYEKKIVYSLFPFDIIHGQAVLMGQENRTRVLKTLSDTYRGNDVHREEIRNGVITISLEKK